MIVYVVGDEQVVHSDPDFPIRKPEKPNYGYSVAWGIKYADDGIGCNYVCVGLVQASGSVKPGTGWEQRATIDEKRWSARVSNAKRHLKKYSQGL